MHFRFYNTSRSLFMSFPVNIKILLLAFIHSINLKKAGVGQPKYCNNAYVHVVLTNLCRIFSILKFFLVWSRSILIQHRASFDRTRFLQWFNP